MWPLTAAIFDIAIHRRGPEDLPASQFLLFVLLALYLLVSSLSLAALGLLQPMDMLVLWVDCAFYLAFVFVLLRMFRHERRFLQTASALLGADVLLSLIGMPLVFWSRASSVAPDEWSVPMALRLLIVVWWIDVAGFVLSRALGRSYLIGLLFVILYVIVSLNIRDLLALATD